MDTELARTFLVVIATGSFVEAAQRLHVTQSTVSTRIQRLEETLGAELFVRNKMGTTLTPAGRQFQRYAALLARTVQQARQELGIVSGFRATLTVGGRIGLWEDLLLRWLPIFSKLAPDIAVRALIGFESDLMEALLEGRADIGVMYTPQARPGLTVELLLEEFVALLEGFELLEGQGVDGPHDPQLALELSDAGGRVGTIGQLGALGGDGDLGLDVEVAADGLDGGLDAHLDLGVLDLGALEQLALLGEGLLLGGAPLAELVEAAGDGAGGL